MDKFLHFASKFLGFAMLAIALEAAGLAAQEPLRPSEQATRAPAEGVVEIPADAVGFVVAGETLVPIRPDANPDPVSDDPPASTDAGGPLTGTAPIDALIRASAARYRVDPYLVACVVHQESHGQIRAVSPKGACGYMQLMPATARRFGVTDIFDPAQNIDAGTRYLRFLLDMFDGNVGLALAGYNAGERRVVEAGYQVPRITETQGYVAAILARYQRRRPPSARSEVSDGSGTSAERKLDDQ